MKHQINELVSVAAKALGEPAHHVRISLGALVLADGSVEVLDCHGATIGTIRPETGWYSGPWSALGCRGAVDESGERTAYRSAPLDGPQGNMSVCPCGQHYHAPN